MCGCTARSSVAARGNVRSAAVWARGAVATTGAADGSTVLQVEGNDTDAEKMSLGALADGFAVKVKGDTFKRSGIPNNTATRPEPAPATAPAWLPGTLVASY